MEIIKNFGLDPVLLVAQIINFLILFFLLKKLLYKPVLDILKKREETIKEGLKNAEKSKLALEKALEEEKKILKKVREKSLKIMEDSKTKAESQAKQIEENTNAQAEKIISEARLQIEQESKEAERKLTEKIGTLSIEILDKALKEMFTEKDEKQLIEKAIKQIGQAN